MTHLILSRLLLIALAVPPLTALVSEAFASVLLPVTPGSAVAEVNNGDAGNTIDGNTGTFWQAADENPAITVDLGAVARIGGIRETSGTFPGNPFTLAVSTDDTTYVQVATGTLTSSAVSDHTFTVQDVRFLRLNVQRTDTEGFGELAELQALLVCGDGLPQLNEGCDDGNTTMGDGCNESCQVESGFECTGEPSVCTVIPVPALPGHGQLALSALLLLAMGAGLGVLTAKPQTRWRSKRSITPQHLAEERGGNICRPSRELG